MKRSVATLNEVFMQILLFGLIEKLIHMLPDKNFQFNMLQSYGQALVFQFCRFRFLTLYFSKFLITSQNNTLVAQHARKATL